MQIGNWVSDSESAIRFSIGSTVLPFWVFLGQHFARCDRNGELGLVNGALGVVTGLCVIWLKFCMITPVKEGMR